MHHSGLPMRSSFFCLGWRWVLQWSLKVLQQLLAKMLLHSLLMRGPLQLQATRRTLMSIPPPPDSWRPCCRYHQHCLQFVMYAVHSWCCVPYIVVSFVCISSWQHLQLVFVYIYEHFVQQYIAYMCSCHVDFGHLWFVMILSYVHETYEPGNAC